MSQFKVDTWGERTIVWVNSDAIDESITFAIKNKVDGLGVSRAHGFLHNNISFLKGLDEIQGLVIPFASNFNLSPLESLSKLKFLTLAETNYPFDFNCFPKIQELRIQFANKFILPTVADKLENLYISGYKPKSKNFTELSYYPKLEKIEINSGNLVSLNGIEKQKTINQVELYYLRSLVSVSALKSTGIEHLHIENCKKIADIDTLSNCKQLNVLRYHDAGEIESIKFINNFNALEEFRFINTTVKDGDMSLLLNLKSVSFSNKKYYSHKVEEIQEYIKNSSI